MGGLLWKYRRSLNAYTQRGAVHDRQNRDQAIAALVDDKMTDWKQRDSTQSRLALAHLRKDVHAVNQGIKTAHIPVSPA